MISFVKFKLKVKPEHALMQRT